MKKYIYLILSLIAYASVAQKNLITVRPINFVEGLYGIAYERAMIKWFSLGAYVDYQNTSLQTNGVKFSSAGFGIVPEARFYLSLKGAPKGFMIGVYAPIRRMDSELGVEGNLGDLSKAQNPLSSSQNIKGTATIEQTNNLVGLGMMVGHQFLILRTLSIGYYVGAAYTTGIVQSPLRATFEAKDPAQQSAANSALSQLKGYEASSQSFEAEIPSTVRVATSILPRIGINIGIAF